PNDAIILIPFLEKLHTSKKMRMGDVIICDKGFSSMKNHIATINRFFVVPIIYPRKNALGLKHVHQYTGRSVEKRVCRTFHLHLAEGLGIGVRELVYW
ncbi:MAG: hypothetical protein ACXQTD_09330, partial [Candidatus Syntropharchaeia archaeon]